MLGTSQVWCVSLTSQVRPTLIPRLTFQRCLSINHGSPIMVRILTARVFTYLSIMYIRIKSNDLDRYRETQFKPIRQQNIHRLHARSAEHMFLMNSFNWRVKILNGDWLIHAVHRSTRWHLLNISDHGVRQFETILSAIWFDCHLIGYTPYITGLRNKLHC